MSSSFLLYGSYGYTGDLIAREAIKQGLQPLLAGRDPVRLGAQAQALNVERLALALENRDALDAALERVPLVLHCAGPFVHTFDPMLQACLRTGTHYLDITGEIAVFEAIALHDQPAREADLTMLPGVGVDVVPTDCLARHVADQIPGATSLKLAIWSSGGSSRGTIKSGIEHIQRPGLVRKEGRIVEVPAGWKTMHVDFGRAMREAVIYPWGDVSTAYYSTGIGDIEVYMVVSDAMRRMMKPMRALKGLLGFPAVKRTLQALADRGPDGPGLEQLEQGWSIFWAEVSDEAGNRSTARLFGPQGYTLTARAAVASVARVLQGEAPSGFQTPSSAFGSDFVLGLKGVMLEEMA